ncbi:glycosyltransferase family 2 protein [Bifidobacterium mongoliense]|uniref:glycosyltransferase family 2 protein n=1 Tax=Bifidobacterium mongoliense TaxID=518643 RepID=UPI0030EE021F
MSAQPVVSVIIPVYKTDPSSLRECLDSVKKQEDDIKLECVVIFDGQTDSKIQNIIAQSGLSSVHVETIAHSGVSSARNRGISVANGDWICFVDADDRLEVQGLSTLVQYGASHDCQIVQGAYRTVLPSSNEIHGYSDLPRTFKDEQLLSFRKEILMPDRGISGVWSKLFRKSFLKQNRLCFEEGLRLGEDTLFVFRAAARATTIGYIPDIVYEYIRNTKSAVRSFNIGYFCDIEVSMSSMYGEICADSNSDFFRQEYELYVLFHVLLIQVHFVFNPQAPWNERERKMQYKALTHHNNVVKCLTWKNVFSFPLVKAISLVALKLRFYSMSKMIAHIRQRQLSE